jgi:hypothetical protein
VCRLDEIRHARDADLDGEDLHAASRTRQPHLP